MHLVDPRSIQLVYRVPDSFLTVHEVAALLKLNQQTVRNWIDRGELPAVRVGQRRVRIRQSDLDAFIASGAISVEQTAHHDESVDRQVELWTRFGAAMADSREAVAGGQQAEVVEALNSLATAAKDLADAIGAQSPG